MPRRAHNKLTDEQSLANILARTDRPDGDAGCWVFTGSRNEWGYGMVARSGRTVSAHRFVYSMLTGEIPTGHVIRHSCHNPACVNPAHLSTGTDADNAADKMTAGRHAAQKGTMQPATGDRHGSRTHPEKWYRGESSALADFTNDQVRQIRICYANGETQRQIAERYAVHVMTINKMVRGLTYTDAGGPIVRKNAYRARGHAALDEPKTCPSTTQR